MDETETAAQAFLALAGYESIVYEPDGNIPPDFLVDGSIAVEVRRLNQNELLVDRYRGLEEVRFPLIDRLHALLRSFGAPRDGKSWFVYFRFQRPVPSWKRLEPLIRNWLNEVLIAGDIIESSRMLADRFKVSILPSAEALETSFVLGGYVDRDANGFVVSQLLQNIPICVAEKESKVARYRANYSKWWLVLVDKIAYSLDAHDRAQLSEHLRLKSTFDRIVLVNPDRPTAYFDLEFGAPLIGREDR